MNWENKEVLITGGTGSLGNKIVETLMERYHPKGIRIFSRDELKQWEMKKRVDEKYPKAPISFLVGDIKDRKRIELATKGVDILIHTAALKQVPSCEFNPLETINTNVIGSQNVIYAALENNISKVMAISTDKAVYPINLYGACKLCMEKLFIHGNIYSGGRSPHFSCCRYGNVLGSRGSVVPLFQKQVKEQGLVTITRKEMTRFWITLKDVAEFVLKAIDKMDGGEVFVPNMPSASILEIAKATTKENVQIKEIGIRPGEKIHETLISEEESAYTFYDSILKCFKIIAGKEKKIVKIFRYDSNTNANWLSKEEIKERVNE